MPHLGLDHHIRMVIDALPDGVVVHRDGRFVFCNAAIARILGYPHADELLGQPVFAVVHPDEREVVAARIRILLRTRQPVPVREERLVRKDGQVVVCLVRAMPVVWDGSDGVMVIAQDVTELRAYEERLAMADRLASVGTLAAGMAHDLNNPLASLVLAVDLSRELASDDGPIDADRASRIRRHLDGVLGAAERLKGIVADLRVFARQPDDVEQLVDPIRPLRAALDLARNEIRHRCRLVVDLDALPAVRGSEGRLVQVFLNLVMNALQAFPDGRSPEQNVLRIGAVALHTVVRIAIEDNGVGIPSDQVHRVFEPYFTTKPAGEGTGLGLWMVHGVVQRLGGHVALQSELGTGTRIELFLPISAGPGLERPVPPPSAGLERRRVLIVDDEPEITDLISEVLREAHDVEVCTDGRLALAAILDHAPDLVICDLMMPEFGGRELYEALVADGRGYEGRVVFATGGAFTSAAAEFLDGIAAIGGRERVLHKPFRLADVRSLVDRWPRA